MRAAVFIALFTAFLLAPPAQAKRMEPAKVEPVEYEGIRYTVPNDDPLRACIRAVDVKTGKTLYEIVVFTNKINPALEEDVQWIFIKGMKLADGKLIVTDERNRSYTVDLKTRAVVPIIPPTTQ